MYFTDPEPVAAVATQSPDWLTIGIALITGLCGGIAGALIAARAQRLLARNSARREAAKSLWNFHRVLHDYALEMESREIRDGTPLLSATTSHDIAEARAAAYIYRGYLDSGDAKLVTRQSLPAWEGASGFMGVSDDIWAWAKGLEAALTQRFGKADL